MPEPLTLAGLTIATLAALPAELIGQGLGSGISRGTRGLLRILRRQPGDLPVNHDLQQATGGALEKALGLLADAVRGRQAECEKPAHRHWCDLFVELARNRKAVSRVDEEFSLDREELFEAVSAGGGAALEAKMSEAVLRWTRSELEEGEGTSEPLWFAEMVRSGFEMPARTRNAGQATSLHQAFCEFFHEDLKSNERVFRIFTVLQNESIREGLADLAGGSAPSEGEVKEVKAALESHSIGSDELAKFLGEESERIHRKLDALRRGQAEIRKGMHKLVKIGAITLAVLGLVAVGVLQLRKGQQGLRTGQEALLAGQEADEKRDAEVRAMLERLNREMAQIRSPDGVRPTAEERYREALAVVSAEEDLKAEDLQGRIREFVAEVKARGEESSIYDRALAAFAEENFEEASRLAESSVVSGRERYGEADERKEEARGALIKSLVLRGQAAAERFRWSNAIEAYEEASGLIDREVEAARWAAVQAELAVIYKEKLDLRRALEHADLAWETQKEIAGAEAVTFRYANMRGIVLLRLGEFERAETIFQQSLRESTRLFGRGHPDTLQTMDLLGSLMVLRGQTKRAQGWLKRAEAVAVATQGEEGRATLRIRCRLGTLDTILGKSQEGEANLRKVLALQRRLFGENDLDTLLTRHALVAPLLGQSKFAETETISRDLIPKWNARTGPESHMVLECTRSLGSALAGQREFDEAVRVQTWVLEVQDRKLGPDHADVLSTLAMLLVTYRMKNDFENANAIGKRLVETMDRILGLEHPEALKLRITTGTFYVEQGNYAEAEAVCAEVLNRIEGKQAPNLVPVRAAAEELKRLILAGKAAP